MVNYLIGVIGRKKDLIKYFFLTYLDKSISFALPLSILFILKDKSVYNLVEVIFSYATITLTIVELGFTNYLFWGYRQAEDKNKFINDAQRFFKFALLVYFLSSFLIILWAYLNQDFQFLIFCALICIRTLFTFFSGFYSSIYRLMEIPSKIYIITIFTNLFSLAFLLVAYLLSWSPVIIYFFIPSAVVLFIVESKYLLTEFQFFKFNDFNKFLKNAVAFAWPIILNTLFMSFMNNYAKIYAYGHLSPQEMTQISYVLRIGLLIQLTHTSFAYFYSKEIFMDATRKFNSRIFKQYSAALLLSTFLVVFIIVVSNVFFYSFVQIPINLSTFLFLLYTLMWCYIAYLELYFGVMNANRKMLYYSIISSALYIALLKGFGEVNVLQLAVMMVMTTLLNLVLVVVGLVRLNVINFAHKN